MDIRWLKTFISAAEHENFRKASEDLFLTQPAVTKHIKRLEEHLATLLFERNGKAVNLTAAGYKFLPYAKEIIAQYEQRLQQFEAWKQGYYRKLTIAAAPQIASSFLPVLIRNFVDANQDIEVIINVVKSFEIGDEVSTGKADLGLTRIKPIQTNITTEVIHKEPVILVGAYCGDSQLTESSALKNYRMITHNHPEYWDDLLVSIKKYYPNVRTMAVNQVEVTKKFIEQGLGVSYLPYTMIKDEVELDKLQEIKPEKITPPESSTYVLTKIVTDEVNAFIKFLKASI